MHKLTFKLASGIRSCIKAPCKGAFCFVRPALGKTFSRRKAPMRCLKYSLPLLLSLVGSLVLGLSASAAEPKKRSFLFTYRVTLKDLPPGELKFWLPAAESNEAQEVRLVKTLSPVPVEMRKEKEYGNSIFFGRMKAPAKEVEIDLRYQVTRYEKVGNIAGRNPFTPASPGELARSLASDRLVPLDEKVRKLAAEVTRGKTTPLAKSRAIYDFVTDSLTYDKSGAGWGRGDIHHACDIRRGNCTDFHALFIGLCRASGIPARFIIGFSIPDGKREGEIGGYHCWAEFYIDGRGWIPVDASEASKNRAKKEYYFGNLCQNRVEFTHGRDVLLDPPQHGEKLNYFIYPYIELDGKPYNGSVKSFSFKEL